MDSVTTKAPKGSLFLTLFSMGLGLALRQMLSLPKPLRFVTNVGGAVAVLLAAACPVVMGQAVEKPGEFVRFLYVTNGFKPDAKFRAPVSLAVDQSGNLVYVCDAEDRMVSAFSQQGAAKFRVGEKGELDDPVAVAVDSSGFLYVSERKARKVKIFDSRNELYAVIDLAGIESETKVQPGRIAVTREGSLLVVDQANQQILIFDKDRTLKKKFGKVGDRRGEFRVIEDVATDRQGRIYVADSAGIPVQVFDKNGGFISHFGVKGETEAGLVQPVALTVDRFDQVWVVDSAEHKVHVYDRIGALLRSFGEYGMVERALFYPVDIDLDRFGRVYVLERGLRRMQVFELEGPYQPLARP